MKGFLIFFCVFSVFAFADSHIGVFADNLTDYFIIIAMELVVALGAIWAIRKAVLLVSDIYGSGYSAGRSDL
ncbi:MAG: hypothetical protein LBU73_02170 [Helicobacteraceae bacterium]|nr:hypothetical protein [Helicobacteraceae bacterium]